MKIILHDGTEIQNAMAGKAGNMLELTMSKTDAVALMSKFMDTDIMSEIEYYSGAWKTVYTGFTWFSYMENPRADEMRVWMKGGENAAVGEPIPLFDEMYMPKGV